MTDPVHAYNGGGDWSQGCGGGKAGGSGAGGRVGRGRSGGIARLRALLPHQDVLHCETRDGLIARCLLQRRSCVSGKGGRSGCLRRLGNHFGIFMFGFTPFTYSITLSFLCISGVFVLSFLAPWRCRLQFAGNVGINVVAEIAVHRFQYCLQCTDPITCVRKIPQL